MRRMLGDRFQMVVEEMPDCRVPADQDELLRSCAFAKGLQQPEESLNRHVHNGFGRLLAGRQVNDMRYAGHRTIDAAAIVDTSFDDLYFVGFRDRPVVTAS